MPGVSDKSGDVPRAKGGSVHEMPRREGKSAGAQAPPAAQAWSPGGLRQAVRTQPRAAKTVTVIQTEAPPTVLRIKPCGVDTIIINTIDSCKLRFREVKEFAQVYTAPGSGSAKM